jgi:ABC-2 type transport system permease protein
MIVMAIIFGSMGRMIGGIEEGFAEKPVVGVVNNDHRELSEIAEKILYDHAEIVYNGTDIDDGLDTVEKEGGVALLVFKSNFTENIYSNKSGEIEILWIMHGVGISDSISPSVVEGLIYQMDYEISKYLIEMNSTINSTIALNPTSRNETTIVKGIETKGWSPGQISAILSSQTFMIPILMMMIIMMTGSTVLSSMGLEKENKTLETLLTLPIKRTSIVAGKIIGSTIVGLIMAGIYMTGFVYYMASLQFSDIDLEGFEFTFTLFDFLLVGLSLFMAILSGLALCMLLGTFVKNFKSAQTLTFPITAMAMIPMFITMFMDFDTAPMAVKILLFIIPFSHPMMAGRALLFNNYLLVFGGIIYTTIFALVTIGISVKIFNSDRVLVGRIKTDKKKRFKLFRSR